MGADLSNVQAGAFRVGAGSFTVPLSFADFGEEVRRGTRRRVVTLTEDLEVPHAVSQMAGHKVAVPTTSLDLITLYKAPSPALDFSTALCPDPRAFLVIRALKEELQALGDLKVTQWYCFNNSKCVSDPHFLPRCESREKSTVFTGTKSH